MGFFKKKNKQENQAKETVINLYNEMPGYSLYELSEELILRIPEDWELEKQEEGRMAFEADDDDGSLYLSVTGYKVSKDKTLDDFASACFTGAVPEVYKPIGAKYLAGNAIVMEFKGIWEGDDYDTYYFVACVEVITETSNYFLVFNYTTQLEFLDCHRETFKKIPNSVLTKHRSN